MCIGADMTNLVSIKSPTSGLADTLRGLAEQAERGELTGLVAAIEAPAGFTFVYSSSLHSSVVLASLLWSNCVNRMRS